MNKEDINIELIKDYFAGKLDAKTMHALEKRALEDPFLAEAMEGFHNRPDNVSKDLDDLQVRLENRIHKESFALKPWLVAASVIMLLGIGTYFIWNNSNNKTQNLAKEIVQNAIVQQPVVANGDSQNLKAVTQDSSSKILLSHNTIKARSVSEKRILTDTNNNIAIVSKPANIRVLSPDIVSPGKKENGGVAATLQGSVSGIAVRPETRTILIIDSVTQNPLVNVSVTASNGNFKAASNSKGYVHLPDSLNEVNISYIGYENKTVAVNNKVVKLQPAAASLNDVVVVGYGTQKKEALTGAVAGVSVTKNNPSPENIYIRGNATLNHTSPLILIDGTPGSITAVSPQDIASVNVLKGAEATALYGARGANGVLLVTTKKGDTNSFSFKKSKANIQASRPQTGWDEFNDYVKTSVRNLDSTGAKGSVILSFSIQPNGHLTDIRIIKGLSDERNLQAISILKNSPLWIYGATTHTGFYTIDF